MTELEDIKKRMQKAGHPEPNVSNYNDYNAYFKDYAIWQKKLKIVEHDAINGRLKNREIKFRGKKKG